jgi:hypothetical protein
MASPFPGMDPYLEGELWQEFHDRLANQISAQLMPLLAPKYVALLAKRYVVDRPAISLLDLPADQRVIYPDVNIAESPARLGELQAVYGAGITAPAVELISPLEESVPILSVEIRDVAQRRLVTVIEILSPVNKRGDGAREYLERRVELLRTQTHILEIDLIRRGNRIPLAGNLPSAPYYVYLSRSERRPYTAVWPVQLRDALPTLPVPLLPPDADVALVLQRAVEACFTLVGYERLLNYAVPPPPPALALEDAARLDARLRAAGFRPAPGQ